MTEYYVVRYTAKQWMNKPDPNKFGRCSKAFYTYDEAQQYAIKRQSMGCDTLLEIVR